MIEIDSIIASDKTYYNKIKSELMIEEDIEGKGLFNRNIDKLYKSQKYLKGRRHFTEIVIKCFVVIEKMESLKESSWSTQELMEKLQSGIDYYKSGFDNSIAEFYRQPPKLKSSDGHVLRSKSELIIDLWLCYHKIEHEYEPVIRKNGKIAIVSDFYLPNYDCFIEYWGYEGDEDYEARKKEKLTLYKELNKRLISIYPSNIENLDKTILNKFTK